VGTGAVVLFTVAVAATFEDLALVTLTETGLAAVVLGHALNWFTGVILSIAFMFAGTMFVLGATNIFTHVAAFVVANLLLLTVTSVSAVNWFAYIVAACLVDIVVVGTVSVLGTCDLGAHFLIGRVIKVTNMLFVTHFHTIIASFASIFSFLFTQ
jgi:hypothetical protein